MANLYYPLSGWMETSYYHVDSENIFNASKEDLSKREKQILELLIEGKPSKEIGDLFHISKQTVDSHRKNMLHKKTLPITVKSSVKRSGVVGFSWCFAHLHIEFSIILLFGKKIGGL